VAHVQAVTQGGKRPWEDADVWPTTREPRESVGLQEAGDRHLQKLWWMSQSIGVSVIS